MEYSTIKLIIGLIAIILTVIWDLKTREIPNWFNSSMITFIFLYGIVIFMITNNAHTILWTIYGIVGGFVIGTLLFYLGFFGGGDAKMLPWIFGILPITTDTIANVGILYSFLILLGILTGLYRWIAHLCNYNNKKNPLPLTPVILLAYIIMFVALTILNS